MGPPWRGRAAIVRLRPWVNHLDAIADVRPPGCSAAARSWWTGSRVTAVAAVYRGDPPTRPQPAPTSPRSRWPTSEAAAAAPARRRPAHAPAALRRPSTAAAAARPPAGLAQAGDPAAHRRLQAPRRLQRARQLSPDERAARRRHALQRQPRPGRRPRGAPAGHPRRRRHAQRRAGRQGRRRPRRWRRDRVRGHATTRSASRVPTSSRERDGLVLVPSYDDARIIAGQGTRRAWRSSSSWPSWRGAG